MADLIRNHKASFNYELLDRYEAGLELLGPEVKSIRTGHGSLEGARVVIRGGEGYLVGAIIPAYQPANTSTDYDPARTRRLLLSKSELATLVGTSERQRLTLIPLAVYNKGRRLKLGFAVARGKKKHDKRETIKKREAARDIDRDRF
ncbi:MAG: SsrA-binding protein SmpB [Candidatus Vogelbacteria bacterium]|nr:SsrA-binding protein SmpB [Candidatus Vogelbacteria bacterium]